MSSSENVTLHPSLTTKMPVLKLPLLSAPSPDDPDKMIKVRVSDATLYRLYTANRKTALWQAWAHLTGQLPPIPNTAAIRPMVPHGSFDPLEGARACFRGIRRPHREEQDGDSVVVYIINPTHTLSWDVSMVCRAKVTRAPSGTVMAVYMRMQDSLHPPMDGISGIITGWEFIPCDTSVVTLPEDFEQRYSLELWRR